MAWSSRITLKPDSDDVGMVTVVWNEGLPDELTLNLGPWRVSHAGKVDIVAAATAKKASLEAKAIKETNLEGILDAALNV